jgi:hypothetical protein
MSRSTVLTAQPFYLSQSLHARRPNHQRNIPSTWTLPRKEMWSGSAPPGKQMGKRWMQTRCDSLRWVRNTYCSPGFLSLTIRRPCTRIRTPFLDPVTNRSRLHYHHFLDRIRLGHCYGDQCWRTGSYYLWLHLCHGAAVLSRRFSRRVCLQLSHRGRK